METRRVTAESPARWAAALARAVEHGLDVLEVGGRQDVVAVESSTAGRVYLVSADGATCGCPAGLAGDGVCLHRALIRHLNGALPIDAEPQPAEPIRTSQIGNVADPGPVDPRVYQLTRERRLAAMAMTAAAGRERAARRRGQAVA